AADPPLGGARPAGARRAGADAARGLRRRPPPRPGLCRPGASAGPWRNHAQAGGRGPRAAGAGAGGHRVGARDRHRQRLPHRLPGRALARGDQPGAPRRPGRRRAREPAGAQRGQRRRGGGRRLRLGARAELRCDLRDRRGRCDSVTFLRVAASRWPHVPRPRPHAGDGSGAGAQRRQRPAHRIVVRDRAALPRRRRAADRIQVLTRSEIFRQGFPMLRRPLVLSLALALSSAPVFAEDLMQTYELARTNDPQLSIAESSRLSTRENAVQARAALLPQIRGTADLSRNHDAGVTGSSRGRAYRASLGQTVFDLGAISDLRAKRDFSTAADYDLEAAGDELIASATLAAAEAAEEAFQKQFDYADKRLEVGLAPITDVHEARAQYDGARANTILVRNALQDAYQALAEITGKPIHALRALPEN